MNRNYASAYSFIAMWVLFAASAAELKAQTLQRSQTISLRPLDPKVQRVVVTTIAADPAGQYLAVAGDDHLIRIINATTLETEHVLGQETVDEKVEANRGHSDLIRTIAFDRTGDRLVSAGNDGKMILWDRRRDFISTQQIESAPALACVRFSPSGKQMAAVGFDEEVYLISRDSTQTPSLRCDCNDLRCCAYRHDGKVLAVAGRDGHVHVFDPASGRELGAYYLHRARVREMIFMPNSDELISVGDDGQMVRFHSGTMQIISRSPVTSGRLFAVAALDVNRIAMAGSDDVIYVARLSPNGDAAAIEEKLNGHVGSIVALTTVGGVLFSGGFDATLRRWYFTDTPPPDSKIARESDSGTR